MGKRARNTPSENNPVHWSWLVSFPLPFVIPAWRDMLLKIKMISFVKTGRYGLLPPDFQWGIWDSLRPFSWLSASVAVPLPLSVNNVHFILIISFYSDALLYQFFLNLLLRVFGCTTFRHFPGLYLILPPLPPSLAEPFSRSGRTVKTKEIIAHLSEALPAHQTRAHLRCFGKCLLRSPSALWCR